LLEPSTPAVRGNPTSGGGGSTAALEPEVGVEPQTVDYLVIGAGPAGLQLEYFLDRAGRDYVLLEAGSVPGRFFQKFPASPDDLHQQATYGA
jgi:NADPH-dependent 2,4-dienoyl-CoA reductase/sulfur reductase-like enzyme